MSRTKKNFLKKYRSEKGLAHHLLRMEGGTYARVEEAAVSLSFFPSFLPSFLLSFFP